MPGFTFPTVGPLWLSVPHLHGTDASLHRAPSVLCSATTAKSPSPVPLLSLVPGYLLNVRRQLALPSSRVIPVHTCPVLRPRWCPVYSPSRSSGLLPSACCKASAFPLSLRSIEVILMTTIAIPISRFNSAACILVLPSLVLLLPGLHVGFSTGLLARL